MKQMISYMSSTKMVMVEYSTLSWHTRSNTSGPNCWSKTRAGAKGRVMSKVRDDTAAPQLNGLNGQVVPYTDAIVVQEVREGGVLVRTLRALVKRGKLRGDEQAQDAWGVQESG